MERCNWDVTKLNWLDSLKIAIINNEHDTIVELYENIPEFDTVEQKLEAAALIETAIEMLEQERDRLSVAMGRFKVTQKYGQGSIGHPSLDKKS